MSGDTLSRKGSLLTHCKELFATRDMTVGSPMKNLIIFSIPMLIGNLAQQLYNTIDSIVVGNYIGDNALAAVGVSGPIINLLLCLFIGISSGAGIMVSQYFGARRTDDLSKTVGVCITLILITTAFVTLSGLLLTEPMMHFLDTPPEVFDMACTYMAIFFAGVIGVAFYNILAGVLRGLGDSFMPLVFLLVTCILNAVLDIWFVAGLDWGVAGVAFATILAQIVSGILCVIRLMQMKNIFTLKWDDLKIRKQYAVQLIKLGLPTGLTQMVFALAGIAIQSLTNSFGPTVMATTIVVMRVDGFAMMPNFTFGTAMATFSGQNIGAKRLDRVKQGTRSGILLSMVTACSLTAIILLFNRTMMGWFTETEELIDMGVRFMRILAVGYIAMGVIQAFSGVMRGAGDTVTPMWISFTTTIIIRVPTAYLLAWLLKSPDCIYISLLISWVLGALIALLAYRFGKWHTKGILQKQKKKSVLPD